MCQPFCTFKCRQMPYVERDAVGNTDVCETHTLGALAHMCWTAYTYRRVAVCFHAQMIKSTTSVYSEYKHIYRVHFEGEIFSLELVSKNLLIKYLYHLMNYIILPYTIELIHTVLNQRIYHLPKKYTSLHILKVYKWQFIKLSPQVALECGHIFLQPRDLL